MSKLEENELSKLKEQESAKSAVLNNLGLIEAQKHAILHSLNGLYEESNEFHKELEEKYGKISVNLEDGSFEEIEDEDGES